MPLSGAAALRLAAPGIAARFHVLLCEEGAALTDEETLARSHELKISLVLRRVHEVAHAEAASKAALKNLLSTRTGAM